MNLNNLREGITYDDVLLVPRYSQIESRQDIDIRTTFLGARYTPIISAPMDTVSGPRMVQALFEVGAYGVLPRFNEDWEAPLTAFRPPYGIAVGVKNLQETRDKLNWYFEQKNPPDSVTIDVAHGHHSLVLDTISLIKRWREATGNDIKIIAGNVATAQGFSVLADFGVDAIRVGIGPGSACTTRETTGVGVPQLTALDDCVKIRNLFTPNVSIIADGGIQKPGDIAKALAVGADIVMLGRLLAGADEAPEGTRYRGQSMVGSNAARGAPEGVVGEVEPTGPVKDTINSLMHYLRSSMSYVGAKNLKEFRDFAQFIRVSPGTHQESLARI